MAWNGFPANVRSTVLKKLKVRYNVDNLAEINNTGSLADNTPEENIPKVWLRVPYLGKQGEHLVRKLIRKLQRNLTKRVKFIVIYQTKKISYFLPKKDKIPELDRNNLVYEFSCPSCSKTYIGKTSRNLRTRLTEHTPTITRTNNNSAISDHLTHCEHAKHLIDINNLYDRLDNNNTDASFSYHHLITNNTKILHFTTYEFQPITLPRRASY